MGTGDSELEKDLLTPIVSWPVKFFGCLDQVEGGAPFCPFFCPLSLICTNSIAGRVYSKTFEEEEICCEMGRTGVCICVGMLPLGVYTPTGGAGLYCCLSSMLREEVAKKYNIKEESFSTNPILNCIILSACYPCSFFQMYSTLRHFEAKNKYEI